MRAGVELPVVWSVMLVIQALLGDGLEAVVLSLGVGAKLKIAQLYSALSRNGIGIWKARDQDISDSP